ncbi:Uncharacterised protein [Clostridium sporogenes]|nr:Uncharacterised protein [Clostridium sporogenes]
MQEHPFQRRLRVRARQRLVQCEIAILGVAGDRQAEMREVHPDLMGPTRFEFRFDEHVVRPAVDEIEHRMRREPVLLHPYAALPFRGRILEQRRLHRAAPAPVGLPFAVRAREVALVHPVLADLLVQADERRALLREHQDPGRLAVEPVHQFEEFRARTRLAHLLDHAERDAAAAVDRDPGRLVDDEHRVVLVQHVEIRGRHDGRVGAREVGRRHAHRRHADEVAELQAVLRVDPALVHAHFAAAEDPVNMAFRHAFTDAQQEVVDALTGRVSSISIIDTWPLATEFWDILPNSFILNIILPSLTLWVA